MLRSELSLQRNVRLQDHKQR